MIIDDLLHIPEVETARASINRLSEGKITFNVKVTPELQAYIHSTFGIECAAATIPMTWIKGDSHPHIDRGAAPFEKTHLAYLTDSQGEFIIGNDTFPIVKGGAHSFSEGLVHETRNTGAEARLLLGPMNERAMPVGAPQKVFMRYVEGTYEESYDQETWYEVSWPYNVYSDLEFVTDMTFTSAEHYFVVGNGGITIGSPSLYEDGTRTVITIDGITDYPGLIQNGTFSTDGNGSIDIYNLEVRAIGGSTLSTGEGTGNGWICQTYYGKNASNNYVINCASDGPINATCGGIVGSNSGTGAGAELVVVGCSSSGEIQEGSGGIIGAAGGNVTCNGCWSTGAISGDGAGGIAGSSAGINGDTVTITRCYSEGVITGINAGGIVGSDTLLCNINFCYSKGNVTADYCGGIMGGGASGTIAISNCYYSGNITGEYCGGISGATESGTITISNCYVCGSVPGDDGYIMGFVSEVNGSVGDGWTLTDNYSEAANGAAGWSTANAATVLDGAPTGSDKIGDVWVATVANQPYELYIGYSPYTTELVNEYSETVEAGLASMAAIISGRSYSILQITGGVSSSYSTISMNQATGVISTTANTVAGTYMIFIRNTGSYHISSVSLEVIPSTNAGLICCEKEMRMSGMEYRDRTQILSGNVLINPVGGVRYPISYEELMNMKRAYISRG
jgi:hypothetical protein